MSEFDWNILLKKNLWLGLRFDPTAKRTERWKANVMDVDGVEAVAESHSPSDAIEIAIGIWELRRRAYDAHHTTNSN